MRNLFSTMLLSVTCVACGGDEAMQGDPEPAPSTQPGTTVAAMTAEERQVLCEEMKAVELAVDRAAVMREVCLASSAREECTEDAVISCTERLVEVSDDFQRTCRVAEAALVAGCEIDGAELLACVDAVFALQENIGINGTCENIDRLLSESSTGPETCTELQARCPQIYVLI